MLIEKSRLSLAAASAIWLAGIQAVAATPASEGKIDSGDVALHHRLLNAEAEATPLLILPATTHLGLLASEDDIARHVSAFLDDEPPSLPQAYARAFEDTKH